MSEAMRVEDLSLARGRKDVLRGIHLSVREGECLGILGPNGSGKTTLLHAMMGFLPVKAGGVRVFGADVFGMDPLERARLLSYVMQDAVGLDHFSVRSFLDLAFYPLKGREDRGLWAAERTALCDEFGIADKLDRKLGTLSGGERQRVSLVQSILQRPRVFLLDEMTNHLDVAYQMEFLKHLVARPQTKVLVLHDVNLALRFCDRILLMKDGEIRAKEVNAETMRNCFGVDCEILRRPDGRRIAIFD